MTHVHSPARTLLRLHGADTPDFLNRLLTLDAKRMPVGTASRAFLLDARGRIVLAMRLRRAEPTVFIADVEPDHADAVRARLDMFHFGEAFAVDADPRRLVCVMGDASPEGAVESDRFGPCWELLLDADAPLPAGEIVDAAWCDARRVSHGVGRWPAEYSPEITPLDVGMAGITEGKGCYPGQEVIERTIALGRPARRLVRVQLDGPAAPGELAIDGKVVGRLTSVADGLGLALIKYKQTGPFERDGVPVTVIEATE